VANRPVAIVVFIMISMFTVAIASAQTETTIQTFKRGLPFGGVIADSRGVLYGATSEGGKDNFGAVYSLSPPATQGGQWTIRSLYSFSGADDGGTPWGSLVLDRNRGKLYGTTQLGGLSNQGVVYELSPPARASDPWTEAVLYNFTGGADGGQPLAGVILNKASLYGTTSTFATANCGAVFRLSPPAQPGGPWTHDVLYGFQGGNDSCGSHASLIFDGTGALYGTTALGGQGMFGTVFKLTPPAGSTVPWAEHILHTFTFGSGDGIVPNASVIFNSNASVLYGTTAAGGSNDHCASNCGTVFSLTRPTQGGAWVENILYNFQGDTDGASPQASLIFDATGSLYGTTSAGGRAPGCTGGCGTVFRLSPPSIQGGSWTENFLYAFNGSGDGATPYAPLIQFGSNFYGTTYRGSQNVNGTVFQITP